MLWHSHEFSREECQVTLSVTSSSEFRGHWNRLQYLWNYGEHLRVTAATVVFALAVLVTLVVLVPAEQNRIEEWNVLNGIRDGVLTQVFGGPIAKVLDQAMYVGNMEQTIPMLVESTGLTYKTVQKAVVKLNRLGVVKRSRRVGNAQTYRFDVRNDLHDLVMWAETLKIERLRHR